MNWSVFGVCLLILAALGGGMYLIGVIAKKIRPRCRFCINDPVRWIVPVGFHFMELGMTTALQKAKAKLRQRSISVTVMAVKHPETGETIGALIPSHPVDRRSLRERRFTVGKQLRATLKLDRNPMFWRKAHVLSGWLADNVELFHGLGQHDALKKLQTESGIGCEVEEFDLPGVGKITRTVAQSLNFDDMEEGEFSELWDGGTGDGGWIGWLRREVFGGLDATSREEVEQIIQRPQP